MLDRKEAKEIAQFVLKELRKTSYPYATDGRFDYAKVSGSKVRSGTIKGLSEGAQAYVANISFSPLDYDTITWASGIVVLLDGRTQPVVSGLLDITDETYIYCTWGNNELQHTTNYNDVISNSKVLVAVASPATDPTSLAYVSNPHSTDILVTTDKVMDNLVTELKLANEAVTNVKIAVDAIHGAVIQAGAITETKISDDAVTTPKIVASGIIASKIAAGAIIAEKIDTDAVTAVKIQANAVTSEKIFAGAVTAVKIDVSTLSAITANCGTLTAGTINGVIFYVADEGKLVLLDGATECGKLYSSGNDSVLTATDDGDDIKLWSKTGQIVLHPYDGIVNCLVDNLYFQTGGVDLVIETSIAGGDIELDPDGADVLPHSTSVDLGTATTYWDNVNASDFIDRTPSPKLIEEALTKIKSIQSHTSVKKRKGHPDEQVYTFDKSTLPKEVIVPVVQRDIDKNNARIAGRQRKLEVLRSRAVRIENKMKKLSINTSERAVYLTTMNDKIKTIREKIGKLEGTPTYEPQSGISMTSTIGLLLSGMKELIGRVEQLEARL